MGIGGDGTVWRFGDSCQPRADDVLLFHHHPVHGVGICYRRTTSEGVYASAESNRCVRGSGHNSCVLEPVEPLSYVGIWSGDHAWQE